LVVHIAGRAAIGPWREHVQGELLQAEVAGLASIPVRQYERDASFARREDEAVVDAPGPDGDVAHPLGLVLVKQADQHGAVVNLPSDPCRRCVPGRHLDG
jgi:hypothetical protein